MTALITYFLILQKYLKLLPIKLSKNKPFKMISIIAAVYNQYEMNKLFLELLEKYTRNEYELLIIDNGSTDGSQKLFRNHGATVIQNAANYSYPYCQNQGIQLAKYDIFAFFNNDIIVSPDWDLKLIASMKKYNLDVCGFGCNDTIEKGFEDIHMIKRKWKSVKNPIHTLFGCRSFALKWMLKLMYRNWENWTENWAKKHKGEIREGLSGSCVICTRHAIDLIGRWDERIQTADFDIFMRTKKRHLELGDIQPPSNIMDIYVHHFGRLTMKKTHPVFFDHENMLELKQKWGDSANPLLKDINVQLTDRLRKLEKSESRI